MDPGLCEENLGVQISTVVSMLTNSTPLDSCLSTHPTMLHDEALLEYENININLPENSTDLGIMENDNHIIINHGVDQVFSNVCATLTDHVFKAIPSETIDSFFENLQLKVTIQMLDKENACSCIVEGSLEGILEARNGLEKFLLKNQNGLSNFFGKKDYNNIPPLSELTNQNDKQNNINRLSDKSVMCELVKAENSLLKPYSIALDRPRRLSTTRSRVNNNSLSIPAVKIREKYKRVKRKVGRPRKFEMSTSFEKMSVTNDVEILLKTNADTAEEKPCEIANLERDASLLEDGMEDNPPRDVMREVTSDVDDGSGIILEESMSQKKMRKNYEELTPFKFFCERCSFKTKRESHYQKHLAIHEKVSTLYTCDKCSFTAIRLTHLRRHEMTHSQTMYECDQCTYKTDEQKLLTRHIKLKHEKSDVQTENPVEVLQCTECPYKTTKQSRFQRHLKVHDGGVRGVVRVYQCDQCVYKTNRKEHYIRHVNNVHINKRPYLCDFCGKAFKRPDALKQHRVTHANTESRDNLFRCGTCQKGCRSQAHLNEHLAVHSSVRSFLCEMCGASFKTRSVQRKHMLTIHKNPRSHVCDHCSKRFNTNYALRRHLRLHQTEDEGVAQIMADEDIITVSIEDVQQQQGSQQTETLSQSIDAQGLSLSVSISPEAMINTTSRSILPVAQLLEMSSGNCPITGHHVLTTTPITIHQVSATEQSSQDALQITGESTTLIPLTENFEHVTSNSASIRQTTTQTFVASEATTALLYLTTNFPM